MIDTIPLSVQVDATLAVMAEAVTKIQEDVSALTEHKDGISASSNECGIIVQRLQAGTEALVAAIAAARAVHPMPMMPPTPVVVPPTDPPMADPVPTI